MRQGASSALTRGTYLQPEAHWDRDDVRQLVYPTSIRYSAVPGTLPGLPLRAEDLGAHETWLSAQLYVNQSNLPQAAGWRNFAFFPLVLHGWLSGWSVLQSHLVVAESKGRAWSPWVAPLANITYFASTVVIFAPLLVSIFAL